MTTTKLKQHPRYYSMLHNSNRQERTLPTVNLLIELIPVFEKHLLNVIVNASAYK